MHDQEILAAEIFWGYGFSPWRSSCTGALLPRFLGRLADHQRFAYLALSFTGLLLPHYEDVVSNIALPANWRVVFMLCSWSWRKGADSEWPASDSCFTTSVTRHY